ncbi:traB domain-containing protein isoform X1 [Hylaeus volcanicus]|uniref:traB domain-containing protein isoform X1 n=1 Tax=Hylaeus volcanicus TaxID=313075 RepID=UPI0023B7BFEF|nr:traB domain-containing protein isoform X1 [Hylaeus volcanicus]XP_053989318.1 traB domain-containing protein isoform X1 [Hylaeus volcanicus]
MNVPQNPMSVEDKHLSVTKEGDPFDAKSKSDMQEMTKNLITNEWKSDKSESKSENEFSTVASSMDPKENETNGFNTQSNSNSKNTNINTLDQNKYDASIDERLPETVTLLTTPEGAKLYLVGTAHFSVESQNDVSMIIQAVQPHIVAVELCKSRVSVLEYNEDDLYQYANSLTYEHIIQTIKEYGTSNGLLRILLLRMLSHVTKDLGMAPGGEFRTAFQEAKKIPNCVVQLSDRPIKTTIQRVVKLLSWWQIIKLTWQLIRIDGHINKEFVETCKQRGVVSDFISKLKEEFPAVEQVFVTERDLCLTYSLQEACLPKLTANGIIQPRVVGVVGIGHTSGIMEHWGKVKQSDIPPLMSVPPQALSTKILQFTTKVSLLSVVIYVGYKILH